MLRVLLAVVAIAALPAVAGADVVSPRQIGQIQSPIAAFDSDASSALYQPGMVQKEAIDYAEAMRRLRTTVTDPLAAATVTLAAGIERPAFARGLAVAEVLRGNNGAALVLLLRAIELAPDDTEAMEMLAGLVIAMGLANEGRAILAEIERIGPPEDGSAIKGEAVRKYLDGYAEMLEGDLDEAIDDFVEAEAADPIIIEHTSKVIAIIEAKRGNRDKAEATLLDRFWRAVPKGRLVAVYGHKPSELVTAATFASVDFNDLSYFQVPAADLFNVAAGSQASPPFYPDPAGPEGDRQWQREFINDFLAAGRDFYTMTLPYQPLRTEMGQRFSEFNANLASGLEVRIGALWLDEPEVRDLWDRAEQERIEMEAAVQRIDADYASAIAPDKRPTCGDYRYNATKAIEQASGAVAGYRRAFDSFYRSYSGYANALAAETPIKSYRQWLDVHGQSVAMQLWSTHYEILRAAYGFSIPEQCYEGAGDLEKKPGEWGKVPDTCPEWMQGRGLEVKLGETELAVDATKGLGFTLGLSCDAISLEMSGEIIGLPLLGGLSIFAQAEYARAGALTVYGGFKAEIEKLGGVNTGLYATVTADGRIADIGVKGAIGAKVGDLSNGLIPVDTNLKSEEMKFTFLPEGWGEPGPAVPIGDPIVVEVSPAAPSAGGG